MLLKMGKEYHVQAVLELEKYIPVMHGRELHEYEQAVVGKNDARLLVKYKSKWEKKLRKRKGRGLKYRNV